MEADCENVCEPGSKACFVHSVPLPGAKVEVEEPDKPEVPIVKRYATGICQYPPCGKETVARFATLPAPRYCPAPKGKTYSVCNYLHAEEKKQKAKPKPAVEFKKPDPPPMMPEPPESKVETPTPNVEAASPAPASWWDLEEFFRACQKALKLMPDKTVVGIAIEADRDGHLTIQPPVWK